MPVSDPQAADLAQGGTRGRGGWAASWRERWAEENDVEVTVGLWETSGT